ncbi:UNVERIFIED_CONTAM: protein FAR1-RELATED SEQUENCE 3 [Sesamum angustifolium]|uniref:Protein FAR1-RELATED SEQUENCE n=1 Tax=Sesamum angustifolium TaxID=2727405 RepID=A0AAW2QST3_9LAMI
MLKIELKSENKWVVTKFGKEHTHPVLSHSEVHHLNPRRHFTARMHSVVESRQGVDIVPSGVMYVSMDGNHVPAEMNHVGKSMSLPKSNYTFKNTGLLNYMTRHPIRRTLGRDAQNLLDYFKKMQAENPGFYYAIQLDEENRMANAFWADARSRQLTVILVMLPLWTGCTEDISTQYHLLHSQGWIITTFLAAMNDRLPVSLSTDKDRAIQVAVSKRREIDPDFDTICTTPVPRTPSPMEKQAANLYTKRIFSKFQEELFETLVYTANRIDGDAANSIYRVAKFEDDNKAYNIVSPNNAEMKANCSCQMFEYSGILCRHVLTVFTVTNVLTLPWRYILKRWTINAKTMKLAEEGAIASETYSVVLASLREGGKKVAGIKRSIAKVPPSISQVVLPCLKSMTWVMENKNSTTLSRVAVINLKLQDYSRTPLGESEVKFSLSRLTLEPMLRSMAYISEQLSTPANKVAVINLKVISVASSIDSYHLYMSSDQTTSGKSEVKFQVSRDTLGAMLRSMAYIREQLSNAIYSKQDNTAKRQRK